MPERQVHFSRCVDFAHEQELEVAVRSGNHSFLGWGTCEKGIVIDLSRMKAVTVDPVPSKYSISLKAEWVTGAAPADLACRLQLPPALPS